MSRLEFEHVEGEAVILLLHVAALKLALVVESFVRGVLSVDVGQLVLNAQNGVSLLSVLQLLKLDYVVSITLLAILIPYSLLR